MRVSASTAWILGLAAGGLICSSVQAAVLYNANVGRKFNPTDTDPLYYNLGPDSGANRILFDDVPIATGAVPNATALVSRVMFDVERTPNAPALTVTAYFAPIVPNNPANGGPNNLPDWGDPGTVTQVGVATLAANGGTLTRTTVTFGDGVTTLFNSGVLNTSPAVDVNNGNGYFMLGLKFSTITNSQGWTIADPGPTTPAGPSPNAADVAANGNIDVLWDYGSQADFGEFTYATDGQGQIIAGAQFFKVEGTVVPEPMSAGATILIGAISLMGSRRRASAQQMSS